MQYYPVAKESLVGILSTKVSPPMHAYIPTVNARYGSTERNIHHWHQGNRFTVPTVHVQLDKFQRWFGSIAQYCVSIYKPTTKLVGLHDSSCPSVHGCVRYVATTILFGFFWVVAQIYPSMRGCFMHNVNLWTACSRSVSQHFATKLL